MTKPKSIFWRLLKAFAGFVVRAWETPNPKPMPRGQVVRWVLVMWIVVVAFDLLVLLGGCHDVNIASREGKAYVIVVPAVAAVITVWVWPKMSKKE